MNVYLYSTYKDFLRAYIAENKQKGLISRIAAICGCDRTYLSQVLNGKAELTPDHLIQFCDSLGLSEEETRYLMLVLLRDRSSSAAARRSFDEKLARLKREGLALSRKIVAREKPFEITEAQRTRYYSSWTFSAVHTLTSIPAYQTPAAMAERLSLPLEQVGRVLRDLVEMRVVKKGKDLYKHTGADVYLPREYAQSASHHLNWRMKSVERATFKEDIHYTVAFSVSSKDVESLRNQIVQLIDKQRLEVRKSGTETAAVFCCDFFTL